MRKSATLPPFVPHRTATSRPARWQFGIQHLHSPLAFRKSHAQTVAWIGAKTGVGPRIILAIAIATCAFHAAPTVAAAQTASAQVDVNANATFLRTGEDDISS